MTCCRHPQMLATMLDPRHKHLGFLTLPKKVETHDKLQQVLLTEEEAGHGSATIADATGDNQEVVHAVQGAVLQDAVPMLFSWVTTTQAVALMM